MICLLSLFQFDVYRVHSLYSLFLPCVHVHVLTSTQMNKNKFYSPLPPPPSPSPQRCDRCKEVGATVGCCTSTCSANYHFLCARMTNCVFLNNKEVYCQQHQSHAQQEDILPEADINVARCIFVETHPDSSGKKIQRVFEADKLSLRIGGCLSKPEDLCSWCRLIAMILC